MAKCDEGYLCQVCGKEVKGITQSDLYLRFVIGRVDPETLHLQAERHIRCNPTLAQFIDSPEFHGLQVAEGFEKDSLDEQFVARETELLTRGFVRLKQLSGSDLPITEYPLPEFRSRYASGA
ncbi:MAG: hypothetical protein VX768_09940 [Planctomycetota bacterium]|nr:hypothetical protein [Planctomycetota bacterium]